MTDILLGVESIELGSLLDAFRQPRGLFPRGFAIRMMN
jgi:hypothetical protein